MEISERCVKFIDSLGSFTSTLNLRYTSRHINFISLQPGINPENIYSIGYVETVTEEDDTGMKGFTFEISRAVLLKFFIWKATKQWK